jgi:hypothetical protein
LPTSCTTCWQQLPAWLWPEKRRKRTYVNQVLARAEVHSSYQPARRCGCGHSNGHYLPEPGAAAAHGDAMAPVYEVMALAWIDRGCGDGELYRPKPLELVARLGTARSEGLGEEGESGPAAADDAA